MSVITNVTKKYSFRKLLVYASEEWMAGATKKYRNVFDAAELTYVRCELSFYPKFSEHETWNCTVVFKCFETTGGIRKEICSLENSTAVKGTENLVYVRDGWGNSQSGSFWKEGVYTWEAYINEEKVGEALFFVNDVGHVLPGVNPYFSVSDLEFYAGGEEGWKTKDRNYLSGFNREKLQYAWAEVQIENKTNASWRYEIFFNFYDEARQFKGQVRREGAVDKDRKNYRYTFDIGWGNVAAGSWKGNFYYLDVVFMDQLVAEGGFETGVADRPGGPMKLFKF